MTPVSCRCRKKCFLSKQIREESAACANRTSNRIVQIFTRKDIYKAIRNLRTQNADLARLHSEYLARFEKNGLKLPLPQAARVKELLEKMTTLQNRFLLNADEDLYVAFRKEELAGVSQGFLSQLKRTDDGLYQAPARIDAVKHLITNAMNAETRRKMMIAFWSRAAEKNGPIIKETLAIRGEIASLMGFIAAFNWVRPRPRGQR